MRMQKPLVDSDTLLGNWAMKPAVVIFLILVTLMSCQSGDKRMKICEQNNTECQQNCTITNANFSQTRPTTQSLQQIPSVCDTGCEKNYQACLKRQENKAIRGTADY
jgi:hypothetical protein